MITQIPWGILKNSEKILWQVKFLLTHNVGLKRVTDFL